MHDGVTLEAHGIPTAVLCTEPFRVTGGAVAEMAGLKDYAFVTLPHPIGSISIDVLKERAKQAAPLVERILTTGSQSPVSGTLAG